MQDADALTSAKQEVCQREAALTSENERMRTELQRLESLLQSADAHMETEIEKLHVELDEAHQKEIAEQIDTHVAKVTNRADSNARIDCVLPLLSGLNVCSLSCAHSQFDLG